MIKAHPFKIYNVCYEQVPIFIRKPLYEQSSNTLKEIFVIEKLHH